jgi:uncharacterized protein (TIGR02099 family)
VNAPAGRRLAARTWRVGAAVVAGLLIVAALALGALRLAIARVPENAARIQAWVEQQTDLRVEYDTIDARLRWFGPEIVLRNVRVLAREGSEAMLVAREGSVGLDLWSLFRTGELVAGRVRFSGPVLTVVRLADGSIRLLGQDERPLDRPPFDLDRLPAGWLVVADATVTYRDLAGDSAPLTFTDIQLDLRREHDSTAVAGSAGLPAALGRRIEFRGDLRGSLERLDELDAQLELRVDRIVLPGLAPFLPSSVARPLAGSGQVQGDVQFMQGTLARARLDLDLAELELELPRREIPSVPVLTLSAPQRPPGASALTLPRVVSTVVQRPAAAGSGTVRYPSLRGTVRLRHVGRDWMLRVQNLNLGGVGARSGAPAEMGLRWRGNAQTTFSTSVSAENLQLADAWPLVLAFAPPAFDAWAGLAPSGEVRSLRAEISRDRAGALPAFTLSADVGELGFAASGRYPGVSGLTGVVSGTDRNGRIALRSTSLTFDLPRIFREPITDVAASGDIEWRREGAQWVLASGPVSIEHPHASASGTFEFRYERPGVSPVLTMDIDVLGADVAFAGRVMPYGVFGSGAVSWLAPAFLGGRVESGHVSYHGPTRSFPFRNGEGDFIATAALRDVAVDYFTGFEPLRAGRGKVEFHNAGFVAQLDGGDVGGVRLDRAEVGIGDMKDPVVEVAAQASGDLGVALPFAQRSPVGAVLGGQFMGLAGSGPAEFSVKLHLPTDRTAATDYVIGTTLRSATVRLPALGAPVERVTGLFEIHNLDMRAQALRGTILGGPFELDVEPGHLAPQTDAQVLLHGRGRALGAGLPAFIGLPQSIRMSGAADWKLEGRIERQRGTHAWSSHYDVASDLAGLGIAAPQPFAKAPVTPRPTRVGLGFSPQGLDDIAVESGPARLRLQFSEGEGGHAKLERGIARFDGKPAVLPQGAGLRFAGDWPEFDLGEWLALGSGEGPGELSKWLGPTDVQVETARIFNFEFSQVGASLRANPGSLEVRLSGPMAQGVVTIPDDLEGGLPIRFDMQRLVLRSVAAPGPADASQPDPRDLPALEFDVADFRWQQRRFGRLAGNVIKDPRGLRLGELEATAPDTTITVQGDWLQGDTGSRTDLTIDLTSTDLGKTSSELDLPGSIEAELAKATARLTWPGGPMGDIIAHMDGAVEISLERGQLRNVKPGAGRMLGLASLAELPRRLALDFHDVTDAGLAFDTVHGDFEIRNGNAYTQDLLLKGAALDIGIVGRTGLAAEDYDQTIVVSGNPTGAATVAGALALGPIGAAGGLLLSQIFKGQLKGLVRVYYRVTGPWADPVVDRISSQQGAEQTAAATATVSADAVAPDGVPAQAEDKDAKQ